MHLHLTNHWVHLILLTWLTLERCGLEPAYYTVVTNFALLANRPIMTAMSLFT